MKHLFPFGLPLPLYAPQEGGGGGDQGGAGDQGGQKEGQQQGQQQGAGDQGQQSGQQSGDSGGQQKQQNANALGGTGDAAPNKETPADFPADWREKLAGGDAKALERLKRMPSPTELAKAWLNADAKISSGKFNADEPMPADPEKAKEWRKARDIPEDPTGYTVPDEIKGKLTDEDKPIVAGFSEAMHKLGMPQKYHAGALSWYTELVQTQAEEQQKADKEAELEVRDVLRDEWGADYQGNNTVAKRYAQEAIPGVDWYTARLPDGRALGNVPEVVKALAKFGLMEYGDAAFAGGEQANKTSNRIDELKKIMQTDFDRWEKDLSLRKEYNDLLTAQERRAASRGGA